MDEVKDLEHKLQQIGVKFDQSSRNNRELEEKLKGAETSMTLLQAKAQKDSSTAVSLKRLQADMAEWRKTAEQNLKQTREELSQSQAELGKVKTAFEKCRAENQMLRRVQQDQRTGEASAQLLREIDELKA